MRGDFADEVNWGDWSLVGFYLHYLAICIAVFLWVSSFGEPDEQRTFGGRIWRPAHSNLPVSRGQQ